jgi:hypothetical protein
VHFLVLGPVVKFFRAWEGLLIELSANESGSDGVDPTSGVTVWEACQIKIVSDLRYDFSAGDKCYRDL